MNKGSEPRTLVPFYGTVHPSFIVDSRQEEKFGALFRERSPFRQIDSFPWLHEMLAKKSARVLEARGERYWAECGGIFNAAGQPFCNMQSEIATSVVKRLENDPGGLLWLDADGTAWAVRLCRAPDRKKLFGFCINWCGTPPMNPAEAEEIMELADEDLQRSRIELQAEVRRTKLFARAQQLLWAIHAEVLQQRRSVVVLADTVLGQIVWGGYRDSWPKNWRHDLITTLRSLTRVRSEVLRLDGRGWAPRFGAESVAVASIEDLRQTRQGEDSCSHSCAMHGSSEPHSHILVQIGLGFLGVLERFATGNETDGAREYSFTSDEAKKKLRNTKQVVKANALARQFGGAKWADLHGDQRAILDNLCREITRGQGRAAAKVIGQLVSNADGKNVECPLLDANLEYVVFGGNGKRKGRGYRIVGAKGTGWLYKCGIEIPDAELPRRAVVRDFLRRLQDLSSKFGFVVAAIHPRSGQWFNPESLISLAKTAGGFQTVLKVHLRVYAPADYEDRIRAYIAVQGGFSQIPGPGGREVASADSMANLIRVSGMPQVKLAELLGISASHLSNLVCGRRQWNVDLVQQCRTILSAS